MVAVKRISYAKRTRVIALYLKHNLNFKRGRFHLLKYIAAKEDIFATERTFRRFVKHWTETGSIANKESMTRSVRKMKVTEDELSILDRLILKNKEMSAKKAKDLLKLRASIRTIQKYFKLLGWKKIVTRFCQFVSQKNRIERVIFCNMCKLNKENFDYSIFIDECTVSMTKTGRLQWYRSGIAGETRSGLQSKYKHTASVHVIGGISRRGATKLIIFSGKLNTAGFKLLAGKFIIPFVNENYSEYHRLHLDNAAFHTKSAEWLNDNNLNHFTTPAQSPDLNVIELVWNDLKYYIGYYVKPNTVQELVQGIIKFWNDIVTIDYCNSKINHIYKVIDTIILLEGKASGL